MKLFICSQTSTVAPLKFVNGWIILSHTLLGMWLLIHNDRLVLFYPDFGETFIKKVHQILMKNIEGDLRWCDIVYFRPVCFGNRFNKSLHISHTVNALHEIYFSFFIIRNPMNAKNWVMISHVTSMPSSEWFYFQHYWSNIVNQIGSCGSYSVGSGD